MIKLIDLIKQNKALKFIDAESSEIFKISDFISNKWLNELPKSLAFLYLDNSLTSVKTILFFLDSQHAFVLLNPKLNDSFKNELELNYSPDFIFDPTRFSVEFYKKINFYDNVTIFERIKKNNYKIHPDLKILLTTSGTTGSPKFVKLSEKNLIENAKSIISYLPINFTDCTPLNLPIFYSYGLSIFTSNSLKGGTIICTNKDILNKDFWSDFEKFGFTSLAGVPYVYEILHRIGFLNKTYKSLKYLTQAGGKLSSKLIEIFHQYTSKENILFYIMYGQTEATARMSYLPPESLPSKISSIGIPILGGAFQIDTVTNELIYSGPNIFGGYAESYNNLNHFESLKTLHTGDVALIDNDGYYYITGRLKRFVKIFGIRTNLDEVENILKNKYLGDSFYVIGTEKEKLAIFVNNALINEADIKSFIKEKMQIHPTAIIIKFLQEIPLTSNGKINYSILVKYV
jgi:acyl-CoA synthetase (AMP-forming)/AMP-acid ligase II